MLLTAQELAQVHSLRTLFEGVCITINRGDRIGLIGPNGAGKSTLLKILSGMTTPDRGTVVLAKGARAVYVPQEDVFQPGATLIECATTAASVAHDRLGLAIDHHEAEIIARRCLEWVGMEQDTHQSLAQTLSGGWRKRLSLAIALAECNAQPDLILLDEPTNHLDMAGIQWLERFLVQRSRSEFASVFVTHDRSFLENIATRIVELSSAYPEGTLSVDGNYTEFLRRKQEFLEGQAKAQQVIANQVRKDLAWLARGPSARRTKAKGRIEDSHARIDELAELKTRNAAAQAQGARVDFDASGRRTRKLIEAKGISKSLGGKLLFSGLDLRLGAGDCLGLLGPNGSGKTTLIRVLTGELSPDQGSVILSDPLPRIAVFSQHRKDFPPETTLREALCPVSDQVRFRGQAMHVVSWARRFLFRDEQLAQPIGSLSGGELARIHIARIMLEPADVLVLDEPTNDLDIPTLELLEESLEDFPGALILVTHDRSMLDRLATRILSLVPGGQAALCAGLAQAMQHQQAAVATPDPSAVRTDRQPRESASPAKRKKLSYNEQREFDAIEQTILDAEATASQLESQLNDPAVLADRNRLTDLSARLADAQQRVSDLYTRWAELDAKQG